MQKFECFKLKGLTAAPFTPFNNEGDIEYGLIDAHVKYLVDHHFENAFVNGTLGEGMSMTVDERKMVAEVWQKAIGTKMKMILHVGDNNLKNARELARHAQTIGVDAIAALCPSYYKPETEEVLVDYMARIAAEAPDIPFYYYCIQFMTGTNLNTARFLHLAKDKIPNLCGIKYSSGDFDVAHACSLVDKKRFQVLVGTDKQYLESLVLGMDVPVSVAYVGDILYYIKKCYDNKDWEQARHWQRKAQTLDSVRTKYGGGFDVAKAMFGIISGLGGCAVRLPLRTLNKEEMENLTRDLIKLKTET